MGRGSRAGRHLGDPRRDIAVTKRRSRFFHTCARPKGHYTVSFLIPVSVKRFSITLIIGNYSIFCGIYRC